MKASHSNLELTAELTPSVRASKWTGVSAGAPGRLEELACLEGESRWGISGPEEAGHSSMGDPGAGTELSPESQSDLMLSSERREADPL